MNATDIENVSYSVGAEGFDYAFRQYSDWREVEDEKFHELLAAYVKAADALENYAVSEELFG